MNQQEYMDWYKTVDKDDCPEGVYGCLTTVLTMMTVEPQKFKVAADVVLNRIETEAEVFMVMGLSGWETDPTDFRAWVRTAKIIGMTEDECRDALDRGAERGRA